MYFTIENSLWEIRIWHQTGTSFVSQTDNFDRSQSTERKKKSSRINADVLFDTSIFLPLFILTFLHISYYSPLYIRHTTVMSNYVQETFLVKFYHFAMYISQEATALGLTISHKFTDINLDSFGKGDIFLSNLTSNDTYQYIMSYQIMLAYCFVVNFQKLHIQRAWKISKFTDIMWLVLPKHWTGNLLYIRSTTVMSNYVQGTFLL